MEVKTSPMLDVQVKLIGPEVEKLALIAAHTGIATTELIQHALQQWLALASKAQTDEADWQALSIAAFEADWDNPADAIYDDWRIHYGVEEG
jgi:hypothetical protein